MKNSLYLFVFILASCTFKQTSNIEIRTDSMTKVLDTLIINNKTYFLESIGQTEFESAYILLSETNEYTNESIEIIDDSIHVSRNCGTLTFHLKNGVDFTLTDIPCVTDDSVYNDLCERYEYVKSYDIIDYWLIRLHLWEGYEYLLLNKTNGKYKGLIEKPIFSPNKKYFLSYSCDFDAGLSFTGIQLFEIKNNMVKELWTRELSEWGPSNIVWKDDTIIFIEQLRRIENEDSLTYKSMKIIH